MYVIIFTDEVQAFYDDLERRAAGGDKDAKIMADKIAYIISRVEMQGTRAGAKFIKDLKGKNNDNLYELRPLYERIFCCLWDGNHFVLLSHYAKDDNDTDTLELARARRLRDEWMKNNPVKKDEDKKKKRR